MNVTDNSPAAVAIRTLAAAAGLRSIHQLAQVARVDKGTLRFALRGERVPCDATVARLASALHVDPDMVRGLFDGVRSR